MRASTLSTIASLFAGAYAHSWLECVKTEVPNKAEYVANPPDKFSWGPDKEKCHGFPRSVKYRPEGAMTVDPGPWGWNEETVYLTYDVGTLPEKSPEGKTYACPERQRTPEKTWKDKSGADVEPPVATAKPGESLLMRHWGNGHSTWNPIYANPMNKDPGVVQVYHPDEWDNGSEMFYDDLTEDNWVPGAQGNFSGDAITLYTDEPRTNANAQGTPQKLMIEHANYFTFKVPESMSTGRHTFVWAWRFLEKQERKNEPITVCDTENFWEEYDIEFTSCFDVEITAEGDGWAYEGGSGASSSSPSASKSSEPESSPEPEADEPAAEEPAPETVEPAAAEEPSQSSGGDICGQPCVRAGNEAYGTCDPASETCPTCVMPGPGGKPSCFETCDWDGMTDCKRGAKKAKRHGHANVHRRSSRLNRFR